MSKLPGKSAPAKRVCLITGASGQFGRAFCETYRNHYDIAAIYRTSSPAVVSQSQVLVDPLDPARTLPENSHPIFAVRADVRDEGQMTRAVELVQARYGKIDFVVNAA